VSKKDKIIKERSALAIIDNTGNTVHRIYVEDASVGLRGANLEGIVASTGQFQGLDLSGANLYWASLGEADFSFANLSRADLRGAKLYGAICRSTKFCGANLGRDNVGGRTSLRGADLSTADLTGANLTGAIYDDLTIFPPGFDPARSGMIHVDELPTNELYRV
jgi:uncharacterized protein YjbI with pentapeptide repeats